MSNVTNKNTIKVTKLTAGVFSLTGVLDQTTVTEFWYHRHNLLPEKAVQVIDLTHISHCDSAGIALLVCLQKEARQSNKPLSFKSIPHQLQQLIKLSHLEDILNRKQAL